MALLQIAEPGESAAPHEHRLAVGIDLGTTNSLVATVRSGMSVVLNDIQGRPLLPSVVAYAADGNEDNNNIALDPLGDGAGGEIQTPDTDHLYLKAGLRRKFNALGHTVMYAEWARYNDMLSPSLIDATNAVVSADSEVNRWGLGLVQEVDAAAMSLWLTYRNIEGEFTIDGVQTDLDDLHMVKAGALINF